MSTGLVEFHRAQFLEQLLHHRPDAHDLGRVVHRLVNRLFIEMFGIDKLNFGSLDQIGAVTRFGMLLGHENSSRSGVVRRCWSRGKVRSGTCISSGLSEP